MAITTTSHFSITLVNSTGHTSYTIMYRITGTTPWTEYSTSGTTVSISGLEPNILYDFQVINVNGTTNPASAIVSSANITDPMPSFSPVNNAISLSFTNLSADITSYKTTIALQSNPTVILATHNPAVAPTVTDTFTGLSPFTSYIITITPAIGLITNTFSYIQTTSATATCPVPLNVTATLM
jgi:Fibronectin type III domain